MKRIHQIVSPLVLLLAVSGIGFAKDHRGSDKDKGQYGYSKGDDCHGRGGHDGHHDGDGHDGDGYGRGGDGYGDGYGYGHGGHGPVDPPEHPIFPIDTNLNRVNLPITTSMGNGGGSEGGNGGTVNPGQGGSGRTNSGGGVILPK